MAAVVFQPLPLICLFRPATRPMATVASPCAPTAGGWSPVVDPHRHPQRPRAAAAEPLTSTASGRRPCAGVQRRCVGRRPPSTRAGAPRRPVAEPSAYASRPTDTKREYSKPCLAFRCLASRPLPLSRRRIRGAVLKLLRRCVSVFILAPARLEYLEKRQFREFRFSCHARRAGSSSTGRPLLAGRRDRASHRQLWTAQCP